MTTPAELRALLRDCVTVWDIPARVEVELAGVTVLAPDGQYLVTAAPPELRPVRWFLQTPERVAANRLPRAAPSIVALLSALRNALGVEGTALRVGEGASA